jgi:methyl coenzyme M reductase gamma subunit
MSVSTLERNSFTSLEQRNNPTERQRIIDIHEVSRAIANLEERQREIQEKENGGIRWEILHALEVLNQQDGVVFTEEARVIFEAYIREYSHNKDNLTKELGLDGKYFS